MWLITIKNFEDCLLFHINIPVYYHILKGNTGYANWHKPPDHVTCYSQKPLLKKTKWKIKHDSQQGKVNLSLVGQIIQLVGKEAEESFMHQLEGKNVFTWPHPPDLLIYYESDVLHIISEPGPQNSWTQNSQVTGNVSKHIILCNGFLRYPTTNCVLIVNCSFQGC